MAKEAVIASATQNDVGSSSTSNGVISHSTKETIGSRATNNAVISIVARDCRGLVCVTGEGITAIAAEQEPDTRRVSVSTR